MKADLKLLDEYVERGLLRKQEDDDLVQYNYSEETNHSDFWDEITLFNRGNIYEKKTGLLIARAMPKFMNLFALPLEEQQWYLSQKNITVTEKLDGCLGIIYKYKGEIRCNSRGGFDNYVTDKMKELLPKYSRLSYILDWQDLNVEVISPETKIICDYGDEQSLNLITSYTTGTWTENDRLTNELISSCTDMPIVKKVDMTWEELLDFQKNSNYEKEGYVVQISDKRVKMKSEDYLRIAGLKAKLHKHTMWRLWKNSIEQGIDVFQPYMENVPDELFTLAKKWKDELEGKMNKLKEDSVKLYRGTLNIKQEKLADYFKENQSELMPLVYNLRNGKSLDKLLIKMVEPENDEGLEEIKGV